MDKRRLYREDIIKIVGECREEGKEILFERRNLFSINFSGLDLSGVKFDSCYMVFCHFDGCNLTNAVFQSSNMNNTYFTKADVSNTLFDDCSLIRADFRWAKGIRSMELRKCNLDTAFIDLETALNGFR